jgi:uncharacterized protein YeaO (DUF488 family)
VTGTVSETYQAALAHDLVDTGDATLVGVVRRPTGWFHSSVDENVPALAPPADLLDETKQRAEELKLAGLCDEEAHNAAWAETEFENRYRQYLAETPAAEEAVDALVERVRDGESICLVCFEGEKKRCHRHLLRAELTRQLES